MEFTKEFKEKTRSDDKKYALSKEFGVSFSTIERWLNLKKSSRLKDIDRIEVLTKFTGLTQDQIFIK